MSVVKLRLGPLGAENFTLVRSGVHWLFPPGYLCRANEVLGYCNISLERATPTLWADAVPFADERLQVAFASRVAGRVYPAPGLAPGGYLNVLGVHPWDPETMLVELDRSDVPPEASDPIPGSAMDLRLLLIAGRRMTELADVHGGLLPGWHSRKRAWWCDAPGDLATLLSLGICDVTGVILGEQAAFFEMFEAMEDPAQIVFMPDHPAVPCAPFLLDQFRRTDAERRDIAADLWRGLHEAKMTPTADDWLFAGTLLAALELSPIRDDHPLLTPDGLTNSGPARAMLLSLSAEPQSLLRHQRLGYSLHMLAHLRGATGPATRNWLATAFEPVRRTIADIYRDYTNLIDAVAQGTGGRFLILNRMSTSGQEDIANYAPFDAPMSDTLSNIASKELNIMLDDLAAERDVTIIDVDAIAAEFGGAEHLPDGIHQSAALQAAIRAEIAHCLGSPGTTVS
jgi:hypothetical protein